MTMLAALSVSAVVLVVIWSVIGWVEFRGKMRRKEIHKGCPGRVVRYVLFCGPLVWAWFVLALVLAALQVNVKRD